MTPRSVVDAPYTGFMHALVRARIPYLPVHADDIERQAGRLTVLILPNVGALVGRTGAPRSDGSSSAADRSLATGATSLYNEWGDPRPDFALADLFGCHRPASCQRRPHAAAADPIGAFAPSPSGHTYLRLAPELRARVDGPTCGRRARHHRRRATPVLRGFDETDLLAVRRHARAAAGRRRAPWCR